jgi:hypothetical protein
MIRRTWIARLFAAAIVALGVSAAPARAGLLPVSVSVQPEAGNFRWTYSIVLPTDYKLQSGDYFTIYDFGGYVDGTANVSFTAPEGASWAFSSSMVGPTPGLLNPTDDPNTANLTWTYSGPTIPTGQLGLGNFAASSLFEDSKVSHFTATNPSLVTGDIDQNVINTITPTGQIIPPPSGVPEPATLALAGLGLPLVGATRLLRRKKK